MAFSLVWEGINAGALDVSALEEIEKQIIEIDPRQVLLQALRGELLMMVQVNEHYRDERTTGVEELDLDDWFGRLLMRALPDGWFDSNCAVMLEWELDNFIVPCRDLPLDEAYKISVEFMEEMEIYKADPWADGGRRVLGLIAMPAIQLVLGQVLKFEAMRCQLLTACALERFRITSGSYPDALAELVPDHVSSLIPDPFLGDVSMRYRLEGSRYRLWSVSKDRIDDGGENDSDVVWRFDGS